MVWVLLIEKELSLGRKGNLSLLWLRKWLLLKKEENFGSICEKLVYEGVFFEWEGLGGIYKLWNNFGQPKTVRN